jgi:acetylornithine deacetylase/succinyl-diaminopimelate desuccinylase-like protein
MIQEVFARTRTDDSQNLLADLLFDLCRIDTTPSSDVDVMRQAESECFDVLERELVPLSFPGAYAERRLINPEISRHPTFTKLHFTRTPERPDGLSPEEAYAGRDNLLYLVPGAEGKNRGVAVNAHLDVIAPFIPPRKEKDALYGRGACDDKGSAAAMVGALKVLADLLRAGGRRLRKNLVCMFVVEEETGGNGTLSLALDRDLKQLYDSVLVMESSDNGICPANRGAVLYRAELSLAGVSLFEMSAFINQELEREGRALRAESLHPLFPHRPVQTCHGMIGQVGEHPSRICGEVSFRIDFGRPPEQPATALIGDCLQDGLEQYIALYGDKTRVADPKTGKPKVDHHFDLHSDDSGFVVDVHGRTGHMGSIRENDGAITKMAHMVRSLVRSRARLESLATCPVRLDLKGARYGDTLVLEGGQGFLPTHNMTEVMERVARAAQRGAENYLRLVGRDEKGAQVVRVTYDKLHNAAFEGDPDSPQMQNAVAAARACGMWREDSVRGFEVSCDARLFATEYPGMPVITAGPGHLCHAHGDEEHLDLDELRTGAEFLAIYLLKELGVSGASDISNR